MKRILIIIAVVTLGGLTAIGPDCYAYAQEGPEYDRRQYQYASGKTGPTDTETVDFDPMSYQYRHMNVPGATTSDEWELEIDEDGDKEIQYLQWGPWGVPWGPQP